MLRKIVTAAFAAALAIALSAPAVEAQKALVYCPVGVDASGCDRIVTALQTRFLDGVDRGFDGSNNTVDLRSVDLQHYGVFVVPSLADDATKQPYALLRAAASRLHFAINGRVAVYSGAPDQGTSNRGDKDALIQNLATWAANGHTRTAGLVGLVAFLDLSEQVGDRYSWVRGISLADVSADAELQAFSDVTPVSTRGGNVLSAGGRSVRFSNMASYGLHIGRYAAARTEVGALGGGSKSQSVLVMYSNADGKDNGTGGTTTGQVGASGASLDVSGVKASLSTTAGTASTATTSGPAITTDKPDYQPGDTVAFTGTGFAPGDTVTITVHEDPTWSYPDRQFASVADGNGAFVNRQMIVDKQDLGVTFTATAVAVPSGLVAQTTFTDGSSAVSGTVTDAVTHAPIPNATVSCLTTGVNPCNNAFSVTTDASGHYTTSNKVQFNGNSANVRLTASATGYTSLSVDVAVSNSTNPTQDFALALAGPTQLAFVSSAFTSVVNACFGPIQVQTQNGSGTATNVTSNTVINLTTDNGSTGAGVFYSSNTCTSSTASVTINSGSNSGSFYYSAVARGNGTHILTATPPVGIAAASQSETINRAEQTTLTATSPTSGTYGDHLTMTATGGSGTGALSFAVVAGSTACSIITTQPDSGKLAITAGTGTCSFTATKAQDNDYNSQTSAPLSVTAGKKTVTVATLTASNKVYDATTAATLTGGTLSGVLAADEANVGLDVSGGTATFDNKDVGNAKTVSATGLALTGTAAPNYVLNPTTATTTANITPLTISGAITASNKVYDDNTSATIATRTLTGVLGSDAVTLTGGTATFADKNVGTGKTVTATGLSLTGADAGDYTLSPTTATTTADITPASLTGSFTAANKVYDGTTSATVSTRSVTGKLGSDDVNLAGGTATFDSKNVGTSKTVTLTGATLTGNDAGNYSLAAGPITTHADITARALVVTATGQNKVYDGTTAATVTLADDRVAGDVFTDSYAVANFSDKNAGASKTVSVTGISISGTDAGNYSFNTTATTTASITPRPLVVSATGVNKVYDGNANATVTLGDNRVSGDVFTDSYTGATFNNKNVGTSKPVSVSGISISGTDAGNYSANTTANTTADITPRALTISATGVNKVYDGTAAATVTLSDNRVSGDSFTDAYSSAAFTDKNVGTGKTVNVSGISISGTDAGNYTSNTTANTTADITQRALSITATGVNKVYDASTNATVTLSDNRVGGDAFTDSYVSASFADKNVGNGKLVTVSGISISGTDAGNYTFNTTTTTTASITPLGITGSITASDKVYDGTAAATILTRTLNGVLSGDVVNYSGGSATFADKNVGNGKTVTGTGLGLSGGDAGNYTVNTTATTTASITPRALHVTATGVNKVYDNSTAAAVTLSDDRVSGDALTTAYAVPATFASKDVGTGIAVSVTGITVSGTDASNYTFNTTAATTANITKRPLTVTVDDKQVVWTGSTITPTYTISLTTGTMAPGETFYSTLGSPSFSPATVVNVGSYSVTVSGLNNSNYAVTIVPGTLTVLDQTAPIGAITSLNPVPLSTNATLTVNINDVNTGNSKIVSWQYTIDGGAPIVMSVASASQVPNLTQSATIPGFSVTDVKKICVVGTDAGGNASAEVCALLAIYDPSAGFVTGGGWIDSPLGAYAADPTLVGKANFGFTSKYQKGATVPTGNTEFQFQAAGLNFSSTNFQWLVIQADNSAQFKGTGTINGAGTYNFLVTAVDGDGSGTKKPDAFRIKITDSAGNTVYDNQMGKDDSGTFATTLGGGSIVIHSK
jgi:hypothetical protein